MPLSLEVIHPHDFTVFRLVSQFFTERICPDDGVMNKHTADDDDNENNIESSYDIVYFSAKFGGDVFFVRKAHNKSFARLSVAFAAGTAAIGDMHTRFRVRGGERVVGVVAVGAGCGSSSRAALGKPVEVLHIAFDRGGIEGVTSHNTFITVAPDTDLCSRKVALAARAHLEGDNIVVAVTGYASWNVVVASQQGATVGAFVISLDDRGVTLATSILNVKPSHVRMGI